MRIGNPPPTNQTSIEVSGIASPNTLTHGVNLSITNGSSADIAPVSGQVELIVANTATVGTIFARDDGGVTSGVGTPIPAQGILFLTLNDTVRLTNASGSTVTVSVNRTSKV